MGQGPQTGGELMMRIFGDWKPYYTAQQTYMRRRILGIFSQTRIATIDECQALFIAGFPFGK
jgi:hypothetical protein